MAGAAPAAQVKTSGGKPAVKSKQAAKAPVAAKVSPAVHGAQRGGGPALTLGTGGASAPAIDVQPPEPIVAQLAPDEIDLSTGELAIPEEAAAAVKEGGNLDAKVRLPGLAEGTLYLRKRGTTFNTFDNRRAILLRHPALRRFAAVSPMVLVLDVKENKVSGWVGLGTPGAIKGHQDALKDAMTKGSDLLGWAGLSNLTLSTFHNRFEGGAIDVGVDDIKFKLGGFVSGTATAALDNTGLSFAGGAAIQIPGGSGEIAINRDATGALSGKAAVTVKFGSAGGTIQASLSRGFFNVMGTVSYSSDRLSGSITICAIDETTAREITRKKPEGGGVPIEVPGPDTPVKPGNRAFCGWGNLDFKVNDWLTGTAMVVVNNVGQATVVGKIAPPKEFRLFDKKPWRQKIFKFEVKAGYGIPVVGQVGIFASIGLDAVAEVGPGILKDITLDGAYSTDPQGPRALSLAGTINISAFAGLELDAKAGLFVTILSHDIKAGVTVTAKAGVRGYVQATPRIGMREPTPGKREYFIQGHMEIAAEPILAFAGSLEVSIDTPWWSPLSDKTWTWPLGELVYPLPGEFGIGADVDYVLGSKKWPEIEWGEVDFDGEKFLGDLMNDNTDKGRGGEKQEKGKWEEGLAESGPGGAKNKGGSGKKPGQLDDDTGPIGRTETFSAGAEHHKIWFEQKGSSANLMMASEAPGRVERKLEAYEASIELLCSEQDEKTARALLVEAKAHVNTLGDEANQLAAMKLAARHAKEINEQNKGKSRKRADQKKGKDGLKEAEKKVTADEHALLDPLSKLVLLLLEVPFKPIKRPAQMHQGQQESVEIVNEKDRAALKVARAKGAERLKEAQVGPLAAGHNKTGRTMVTTAGDKVSAIGETVAKAKTKFGKVNARVYTRLEVSAGEAQTLVGSLGQDMRIARLVRLLVIEKMPHKVEVPFPANPAELKAKAKRKKKNEKLYLDTFIHELKRQLELQERGANRLTVDEWVFNRNLFKMDHARFLELDTNARVELLTEFKARAENALATVRTRRAQLKSALAAIDGALKKANAGDDKAVPASAKVNVKGVAGRTGNETEFRDKLERVAGAAVSKPDLTPDAATREETQESIFKYLRDQHKHLNDEHKRLTNEDIDWAVLTRSGSDLVILHNPDQVAGGYDRFSDLPEEPKPNADVSIWQDYLKRLMEHVGPRAVNSSIGALWKTRVDGVHKQVTTLVLPPTHPITQLYLALLAKIG